MRISKIIFIAAASLFLIIWLFVRFYLEDYARDKVIALFSESTKGVYKMEIDDVDINLLTSSFDVDGLKIYADSSRWDAATKDTMKFSFYLEVPQMEVTSFRWVNFLKTDSMGIGSIYFRGGKVELFEIKDSVQKRNFLFELPQIVNGFTPHLSVEELSLEQLSGTIHSLDTRGTYIYKSSMKKLNAGFYKLDIDEHTTFEKAPLFYSDSSFISASGFDHAKPKQQYNVGKIFFNSSDSLLTVNKVDFYLEEDTGSFPSFKVKNFNVKQFLLHDVLIANEFALQYDELFIKSLSGEGTKTDMGDVKTKIYTAVTNITPKMHLDLLDVYGEYLQIGDTTAGKSSFLAKSVSLTFNNIDIDTSITPEDDGKVLFSDRVSLSFDNIRSRSSKGGDVKVRKLTVSSTDSLIYLFDLALYKKGQYSLEVPETIVEKFNWKKYWNDGQITIKNLTFNKPEIIINSKKSKADSTRNVATALSEISKDLNIERIRVRNGSFKRYIRGATKGLQYLEAENLYVTLSHIHLEEGMPSGQATREVFSSVRNIYMKNYSLKTVGGEVVVTAKTIKNRENYKNIVVENISAHKRNQVNVDVALLTIDNIDWQKYWYGEGILSINAIKFQRPEVTLLVRKYKKESTDTLEKLSMKELLPLFIEDFSRGVEIAKIELNNGKLVTDISDSLHQHSIHKIDDYNLKIVGFSVYPEGTQEKFLFANDVDINLVNYSYHKDDLDLKVKNAHLSIRKNTLELEKVVFNNNDVNITMPSMQVVDIRFSAYWKHQLLDIGSILLNKPKVVIAKTQQASTTSVDGEKVVTDVSQVLRTISERITIKEIKSVGGYFTHQLIKSNGTQLTELSDFNLNVTDVLLDSTDGFRDGRLFFAKDILLKGKNFKFLPRDRSHFILVEDILLTSSDSSLLFNKVTFQVPSRVGVNIPSIALNRVGIEKYYKHKGLTIAEVLINRPEINVKVDKSLTNPFTVTPPTFFNLRKNLPGVIGQFTQHLNIERLNLKKGSFFYEGKSHDKTSFHSIDEFEVTLTQFNIDSSVAKNSAYNTLFSDDIFFKIREYSHTTADSVFLFAFNEMRGSTDKGILFIENLVYSPYTKYDRYFNTLKYRTTRLDIKMGNILANNFDYARAVHDQEISMTGLYLKDGLVNAFTDKRLEKDPNYSPPMPNDLMINTPFYVAIDTVGVMNTSFIYNEKEYGQTEVGAISFNDAEIRINNLTNDPANRVPTHLSGRAKFMDDGLLTLDMTIPMLSDEFTCEYSGSLGQMEAYHINRMLEPNQGIGFEKGQINYVNFEADIKGNITEGEMEASFNDLKLRVLHDDNQGKKGLTSMMSNILIPNKSKRKRRGKIHYISHSTDGFLKIVWRGVRSGLTDTVLPEFLRQKN